MPITTIPFTFPTVNASVQVGDIVNNSVKKAEIFSVGSEISESSK